MNNSNVIEVTLFMLNEELYHGLSMKGKDPEKSQFYNQVITPSDKAIFRIKYPVDVKGWYSLDAGLITKAAKWIEDNHKPENGQESKPAASKAATKEFDLFALVVEKGSPEKAQEYLTSLKKPTAEQKKGIAFLNMQL